MYSLNEIQHKCNKLVIVNSMEADFPQMICQISALTVRIIVPMRFAKARFFNRMYEE